MKTGGFIVIFLITAMSAGASRAGEAFASALNQAGALPAAEAAAPRASAPAPEARQAGAPCISQLRLVAKDATRFNAIVDDETVAAALRAAAAQYYEGEAHLMYVKFIDGASFMVTDLARQADGSYSAGQFAPRLELLSSGKARLTLTYFRWNDHYTYTYKEVASFELTVCGAR